MKNEKERPTLGCFTFTWTRAFTCPCIGYLLVLISYCQYYYHACGDERRHPHPARACSGWCELWQKDTHRRPSRSSLPRTSSLSSLSRAMSMSMATVMEDPWASRGSGAIVTSPPVCRSLVVAIAVAAPRAQVLTCARSHDPWARAQTQTQALEVFVVVTPGTWVLVMEAVETGARRWR